MLDVRNATVQSIEHKLGHFAFAVNFSINNEAYTFPLFAASSADRSVWMAVLHQATLLPDG